MPHIAILGAGIGGLPSAYELRAVLGSHHKITLINERDYFQFTPSNPWVAVGKRERKAITFELRPYLEKNQVVFNNGTSLDYDFLVIATRPSLAFNEVEGSGPDGYTQSIYTTAHAEQAYDAYTSLLSKGSGHIIIGAMPSASCFGPAY